MDAAKPKPSQLYVQMTLPSADAFLPTMRLVQAGAVNDVRRKREPHPSIPRPLPGPPRRRGGFMHDFTVIKAIRVARVMNVMSVSMGKSAASCEF